MVPPHPEEADMKVTVLKGLPPSVAIRPVQQSNRLVVRFFPAAMVGVCVAASSNGFGAVYPRKVADDGCSLCTDELSCEKLLSDWADDAFANVHPSRALPHAGLFQCIGWSLVRGEAKQSE